MEVIALRDCNWEVKGKVYELEKGKKYKFPKALEDYIIASGLFQISED